MDKFLKILFKSFLTKLLFFYTQKSLYKMLVQSFYTRHNIRKQTFSYGSCSLTRESRGRVCL